MVSLDLVVSTRQRGSKLQLCACSAGLNRNFDDGIVSGTKLSTDKISVQKLQLTSGKCSFRKIKSGTF